MPLIAILPPGREPVSRKLSRPSRYCLCARLFDTLSSRQHDPAGSLSSHTRAPHSTGQDSQLFDGSCRSRTGLGASRRKETPGRATSCCYNALRSLAPALFLGKWAEKSCAISFYVQHILQRAVEGRELLDIFASEFRDRPQEYYKDAIERGAVVVNGKPVESTRHIVKNGDIISHTLHRHEPPVTALPIGILHEDNDMIVINKPAGVPVHPAGRYNYNSVIEIMRAERGHSWNPLPCNRLDRLTSGVMFIGKHAKAAEELSVQIMGRTVRKEYVARVKGEFPEGEVVCDMPILQISPKLGLNRVRANGKDARTVFKRLAYYPPPPRSAAAGTTRIDGDQGERTDFDEKKPWFKKEGYSIVRCLPVTGRTHQLRVHLQFLGHPISNDPIYCNQRVWGATLGANDADASQDSDEDIITRLSRMGKSEVADAVAYHDEMVDEYNKKKAEKMSGELCDVCATPLYTDPGVQELGIYLHSLRYEDVGGSWSYVSPLPAWALPPDGVDGPTEVGDMEDLVAAANKAAEPEVNSETDVNRQ